MCSCYINLQANRLISILYFHFELLFGVNIPKDSHQEDAEQLFRKTLGLYMGFRKIHYVVKRSNIYIDQMSQSTGEIVYEWHVSSESSFGSRTGHSRG